MDTKKRIVILGGGESGAGAAVLAKVKGFDVFLSDRGEIAAEHAALLKKWDIPYEEGHHTEELILNADEIIKSPGIPSTAPMIRKIEEKGIHIISEIEFAGRYDTAKKICITGSNGKTTTTSLIYYLLKEAGLNVGLGVIAFVGYKLDILPAQRIETAISRIFTKSTDKILAEMHTKKPGSPEFQKLLDANRQRISAKVAVSEGTGLLGKGPGNSTQKYVVSVIYEDYMFSFIIEEYGIIGALFIMFIYGSLLARGSMLVRQCEDRYARALIAGLIILISGQALLHMMVNLDMRIHTGQTLPMISHGKSAFIAFSIAFGIILSVSRMAKLKNTQATKSAEDAEAEKELPDGQ